MVGRTDQWTDRPASDRSTSLHFLEVGTLVLTVLLIAGALSDSSTSKYRRRYWIILSTVALVISTLTLAYCQKLAAFIVDIFAVGVGDWDEERKKWVLLRLQRYRTYSYTLPGR